MTEPSETTGHRRQIPHYSKEELEGLLGEAAVGLAPRLFAIYGVTDEMSAYIGWGMDFGEDHGAMFYCPDENTTWQSDSAEQLCGRQQMFRDAKLHWLTGEPEPAGMPGGPPPS